MIILPQANKLRYSNSTSTVPPIERGLQKIIGSSTDYQSVVEWLHCTVLYISGLYITVLCTSPHRPRPYSTCTEERNAKHRPQHSHSRFSELIPVDYQRSLLPFNDSRVWFLLPLQVLLMGSWHVFIPAQTYWGDIEYLACLWMYGIFDHS